MPDQNPTTEVSILEVFQKMADAWPSGAVARQEVPQFSGGIYSPGYLANLDSRGEGPPAFRCGRKIIYPKAQLIEWMLRRSSPVKEVSR